MAKTKTIQHKSTDKDVVTLSEFRAWLSGVEEMQPAGWAPDAAQWKKIRDKIATISDTITDAPSTVVAGTNSPSASQPAPAKVVHHPLTPPQSTFIPSGMVPRQPTNLMSGPIATGDGSNTSSPVKTPSIDTSDGTYKSTFA